MPKSLARSCCALILLLTFGCQAQPPSKPLHGLQIKIVPGFLTHDVLLHNGSPSELTAVDLEVTIYTQSTKEVLPRHFGNWPTGENQVIHFPATHGRIERVAVTGAGSSDRGSLRIDEDWTFSYNAKAPK